MIEATAITDVTPITIPRIVKAERTLRAFRVSSATSRFSRSSVRFTLLAPQRRYRIETRRFHGRINSEKDAQGRAEKHPQQRHPGLHRSWERRKGAKRHRTEEPDADPDQPTRHALHHALGKKLLQNIALCGTYRAPHAYLFCALGHTHQHHVHDDDAAHHR